MKKKIIIIIGLIVLLSMGIYLVVDYQNKQKEEQEHQAVQVVEQAIASLYVDENRTELYEGINEEDFKQIRERISHVKNNERVNEFNQELEDIEQLIAAQEKVRALLENGIVVEDINEDILESIKELMNEIEEINPAFAELLMRDVNEISSQYVSLVKAREEVYALFADDEHTTMKIEVTRDQYGAAKFSLESLVNEKEKNKLLKLLNVIDAELTEREEIERNRVESEKRMATLTVGKAQDIATKKLDEFLSILNQLGRDNNWIGTGSGVYSVAKPRLLEIVTEKHVDTLVSYVEEYYCECDSIWLPYLSDDMVRFELTSKTENRFVISAIELIDGFMVGPAYKVNYAFKNEDGVWKIDGWEFDSLEGINLKLTKDEISHSPWANFGRVIDISETYAMNTGEKIYRLDFESEASILISSATGQLIE